MLANAIALISIALEAVIAVLAILAAQKQRPYLYGLALTFAIYVLYDLARFMSWDVQQGILPALFLAATVAALVAVWGLYKERS
jgi:hypothetical protein